MQEYEVIIHISKDTCHQVVGKVLGYVPVTLGKENVTQYWGNTGSYANALLLYIGMVVEHDHGGCKVKFQEFQEGLYW